MRHVYFWLKMRKFFKNWKLWAWIFWQWLRSKIYLRWYADEYRKYCASVMVCSQWRTARQLINKYNEERISREKILVGQRPLRDRPIETLHQLDQATLTLSPVNTNEQRLPNLTTNKQTKKFAMFKPNKQAKGFAMLKTKYQIGVWFW